jgi:Uma2 family endonuclease
MANSVLPPFDAPYAVLWTRDDCARLEELGFLNYRYELVGGVIVKMGQNTPHANVVRRVILWLIAVFGGEFFLSQTSINVLPEENPTNAPQPDAMALSRSADTITGNPLPEDILLLIEVADTTLRYDLTTKAGLYARADITEYWVVSLTERRLYVHREPRDGDYRSVSTFSEDEEAVCLARPDAPPIAVGELLPPLNSDGGL